MPSCTLQHLGAAFGTAVVLLAAPAYSAPWPEYAASSLVQVAENRQGEPWRVEELNGDGRVRRSGESFRALSVGQKVAVGSEIVTGRNSKLVLVRAQDRLEMSPASWVRLAPPQPGGLVDRFVQTLGSILYDVESWRGRSFGVEAPYIATVVKGTRFVVTAGLNVSSVEVERGKVQVTSRITGKSAIVEAGQRASAGTRERGALIRSSFDGLNGESDRGSFNGESDANATSEGSGTPQAESETKAAQATPSSADGEDSAKQKSNKGKKDKKGRDDKKNEGDDD